MRTLLVVYDLSVLLPAIDDVCFDSDVSLHFVLSRLYFKWL